MGTKESKENCSWLPALSPSWLTPCGKMISMLFTVFLVQPGWIFANEIDSTPDENVEGEVSVIHIDEVNPQESRTAYLLLKSGSSEIIEMKFDGAPPKHLRKHLRTGRKIRVKGRWEARRAERQARVQDRQAESERRRDIRVTEVAALNGESSTAQANDSVAATAIGDRKTITFIINMDGVDYNAEGASPYTSTHVDLAGQYMHDSVQFSVNSAYEEASFGQVTFPGSASTDVFLVSIPYDPNEACSYYSIASQVDAVSPVSLSGYMHRMYVVPPRAISGCSWLALGQVGSYGSTAPRRSWSTRIDPIAFAHELGHNIGWHHAATDPDNDGNRNAEYGDTSDLMGYCCSKRKLNSVHMDQAGWLDRQDLQEKVIDVNASGQYTLAPLGNDPLSSSDPQVLKITPSIGRPYYLSYRQRTGKDAGISSSYTTGVNIHRGEKSNNWSYLVKVLKSDFSNRSLYEFQDVENNLTISQTENNANYVRFNVSFGGECVLGETQVALSPKTQEVNSLTERSVYSVQISNNDSTECGDTNYQVSLVSITDVQGNVVASITGVVADSSVVVGPQDQGATTVTLGMSDVENGIYTMVLDISEQKVNEPLHADQASGSLNVNVCEVGAPTVAVTPSTQVVTESSQVQPYQVTVTNRDSAACGSTNWSVGLTSAVSGTVTNPVMTIGPGGSAGTTIHLDMAGMANGQYPMTITVTDAGNDSVMHTASATASVELNQAVCEVGAPTVAVTPSTQVVTESSQVQPYQVTVTNRDSAACGSTNWSVGLTSAVSGTVTNPVMTIGPGGSAGTTIHLDMAGMANGQYPMTITVTDAGNDSVMHTASATASVELNQAVCEVGAPTVAVTPSTQVVTESSQVQPYQVTVTNRDSAACAPTNFSVALEPIVDGRGSVEFGVTGIVKNTVLVVEPGATKRTTVEIALKTVDNDVYTIPLRIFDQKLSTPTHRVLVKRTLQIQFNNQDALLPPVNLTASLVGRKRVRVALKWNAPSNAKEVKSYSIYRNGRRLGGTKRLRFKDKSFSQTQRNEYEVYSVSKDGELSTIPARTTIVMEASVLPPPSGVTTKLKGRKRKKVEIKWNKPREASEVAGYIVYRNGMRLGATKKTRFKDSSFSVTNQNIYEVFSVDKKGKRSSESASGFFIYQIPVVDSSKVTK